MRKKIVEDSKFDGFYVYETNRRDLSVPEIIEIYSKQWQIESNFKTFKGTLLLRPVYLSSWNHIIGYICLCFISLVFLNYLIYILDNTLGLAGKSKITEHKLINVIRDVKELEIYIDKQKVQSINIYNDELSESWETYKLLLDIFIKENIE